jgi:hypothetical protein
MSLITSNQEGIGAVVRRRIFCNTLSSLCEMLDEDTFYLTDFKYCLSTYV